MITAPIDGAEFPLTEPTTVTIVWTALPDITRYGVEFTGPNLRFANRNGSGPDSENGFGGAGGGMVVAGTGLAQVLDPATTPQGRYQVRVIGFSASGVPVGTFSDAVTVALGTGMPTIIAPAAGTRLGPGTEVTFAWTPVTGVQGYFLEFSGVNREFSNPNGSVQDPINGSGGAGGGLPFAGTELRVTVPPSTPPGTYRVRVIGALPNGRLVGRFSDAVTLIVE
jgi:hypothetical protein